MVEYHFRVFWPGRPKGTKYHISYKTYKTSLIANQRGYFYAKKKSSPNEEFLVTTYPVEIQESLF